MGRARQIASGENQDRILLDASAASTDEGEHLLLDGSAASTDVGFFINTEIGTTETPPEGFVGTSSIAADAIDNTKIADDAITIPKIDATARRKNQNVIVNGDMAISQRDNYAGTGTTGAGATDGYHGVDRWFMNVGDTSAGRFSFSQSSDTPDGFNNSVKIDCTTADTSIAAGEFLIFQQLIEGHNMQTFAKGTSSAESFAVSFYVKGNAPAVYTCELFDNDNNRQISKTFKVSTNWERVKLIFPPDTTGALDDNIQHSFSLSIWIHAGSTYTGGTLNSSAWAGTTTNARASSDATSFFDSTDRELFFTGVQLEPGDVVQEFQHEDFQSNLTRCQRYYNAGTDDSIYGGYGSSSAADYSTIWWGVKMRNTPTVAGVGSSNTAQNLDQNFAQCYRVGGYALWNAYWYADAELPD